MLKDADAVASDANAASGMAFAIQSVPGSANMVQFCFWNATGSLRSSGNGMVSSGFTHKLSVKVPLAPSKPAGGVGMAAVSIAAARCSGSTEITWRAGNGSRNTTKTEPYGSNRSAASTCLAPL